MFDKPTLEAHLQRLTSDWTNLQAAVTQREQEIQQIDRRRAQLTEEILRNQGALAYNSLLAETAKKQLAELEQVAAARG